MSSRTTVEPRAGLLELCSALSALQRCDRLGDVVAAASDLLAGAGVKALLAAVVRDPYTDSWLLEAISCASTTIAGFSPVHLAVSGSEPDAEQAGWLVLAAAEGAWPAAGTPPALIERVFLAELHERTPRGLLVAIAARPADQELLAALLRGASPAVERVLRRRSLEEEGFLLARPAFEERVAQEIGRARRYNREVSLMVWRPRLAGQIRACGELLSSRVRRWDAIWVLDPESHEIGALLPETGRGGALGTLNRLRVELGGARAGMAVFPDDGRSQSQLIGVARMRSTRIVAPSPADEIAPGTQWFRGAPAGLGPETVLCPSCLQPYSRAWRRQANRAVALLDVDAVLDWLESVCPEHGGHIVVPAGGAELNPAAGLQVAAPVMALLARLAEQSGPLRRAAGLRPEDERVA